MRVHGSRSNRPAIPRDFWKQGVVYHELYEAWSRPTQLMNSYATSFSTDEELCGTPDEMLTQRRLIEAEDWLQTQQGLLSQGRTLLVFGAQRFSLVSLETIVKRFRRVLIHSGREKLNEITAHLRAAGAEVNEALSLH